MKKIKYSILPTFPVLHSGLLKFDIYQQLHSESNSSETGGKLQN